MPGEVLGKKRRSTTSTAFSPHVVQTVFDMKYYHNDCVRARAQGERRKKSGGQGVGNAGKNLALVVIVDDLDRCPKEKIMEMLKATHLLLEHPQAPMAVFLAVDPQLIVSAIAEYLEGVPNTVSTCCVGALIPVRTCRKPICHRF